MTFKHWIKITPSRVCVDGVDIDTSTSVSGSAMLTQLYRSKVNDYPKFFKMDTLCKLGFIASELLLKAENKMRFEPCEDRAVVFLNKSASLCNDKHYQQTISSPDDYFPSPSVFVYTLANIVTGEIAIRNKYYGETDFLVADYLDVDTLAQVLQHPFYDDMTDSLLGGWLECEDDDHFEAELFIVEREDTIGGSALSQESLLAVLNA